MAIRRNRDVFVDDSLDRQDLADLAGGELLEPDITVPLLIGRCEEVNSVPRDIPAAVDMHGIDVLYFLSPLHRNSPEAHFQRESFAVVNVFPVRRFLFPRPLVARDLNRFAAFGRHPPDLRAATAV